MAAWDFFWISSLIPFLCAFRSVCQNDGSGAFGGARGAPFRLADDLYVCGASSDRVPIFLDTDTKLSVCTQLGRRYYNCWVVCGRIYDLLSAHADLRESIQRVLQPDDASSTEGTGCGGYREGME